MSRRPSIRTWLAWGLVPLLAAGWTTAAEAGWLRPIEGGGNFHATLDVVSFRNAAGSVDAVLLVAIENREVSFEREAGRWQGRLRLTARLVGPEGEVVERESTVRLRARSEAEVNSPTLNQIFTLTLPDVGFETARCEVLIEDLNRYRPGLLNLLSKELARSVAVADWVGPLPLSESGAGLAVGDLVYLAHAPIREWLRDANPVGVGAGGPWDYLHPLRRYGIEQPRVQVYFLLEPPLATADRRAAAGTDLRVEILSKELDYALRDTLRLTAPVRDALAAGSTAAVYYEMDTELMPPGSYRLAIAPLGGQGLGYLGEFDVTWRLDQMARGRDELMGEGRTVFRDAEREQFVTASRVEQEVMLDRFWHELDPDPATPYNEVYAEFRRRLSHVREHYQGFGDAGARDPRGEIYLLLGKPDSIRRETMPLNEKDQEDARIQVYQPYAPDREGTMIKVEQVLGSGDPWAQRAGIPMPRSPKAEQEIAANKTSSKGDKAFELWRYDSVAGSLFDHAYSDHLGGIRFLFVDTNGTGRFVLESSNAYWGGE